MLYELTSLVFMVVSFNYFMRSEQISFLRREREREMVERGEDMGCVGEDMGRGSSIPSHSLQFRRSLSPPTRSLLYLPLSICLF